jgi:hypothetical protein
MIRRYAEHHLVMAVIERNKMYEAYFINKLTGELKRVGEPWRDPPPEWKQITGEDYDLFVMVHTHGVLVGRGYK